MAVIGNGLEEGAHVDGLMDIGRQGFIDGRRRHPGRHFLVAVAMELLRRLQGENFPHPVNGLLLVLAQMVGASGELRMHPGPA